MDSSGNEREIVILDLSSGGFRFENSGGLLVGELVKISDDRGVVVPATVRWILGNEGGGVFLEPIDENDMTLR